MEFTFHVSFEIQQHFFILSKIILLFVSHLNMLSRTKELISHHFDSQHQTSRHATTSTLKLTAPTQRHPHNPNAKKRPQITVGFDFFRLSFFNGVVPSFLVLHHHHRHSTISFLHINIRSMEYSSNLFCMTILNIECQ